VGIKEWRMKEHDYCSHQPAKSNIGSVSAPRQGTLTHNQDRIANTCSVLERMCRDAINFEQFPGSLPAEYLSKTKH
jgi:hypothetical protein